MIMPGKLFPLQLNQVLNLMKDLSCNQIKGVSNKSVGIDIEYSRSASAFEHNFVKGAFGPLQEFSTLSGTAESCMATHQGNLCYEVIDDGAKIAKLQIDELVMKDFECRLYGAQMCFGNFQIDFDNESKGERSDSLEVFYGCIQLGYSGSHTMLAPYVQVTYLLSLQAFASVCQSSERLALLKHLTLEQKQKLTFF